MRFIKKVVMFVTGCALLLPIGTGVTLADDNVVTVIEKAMVQYDQGDYEGAASNLEYASQLIRQERNERMHMLLPSPLEGWLADPAEGRNVGTGVLGEGVNASREYKKKQSVVRVEVLAGSPVLKSIVMMLENPMFVGASGSTVEAVGQRRVIVTYDAEKRSGEVNVVVANKYVVLIKGQLVERADLLAYCKRIDYRLLEGARKNPGT